MAQPTLGVRAEAIGVQGGRCASGHEEAVEVEAVIWFGIVAIIVIAVVIAAIGRPHDGPGRRSRHRGVGSSSPRRSGARSGAYVASGWSGDTGSGSCGGDSSGGFSGGGGCDGGGGSF